MPLASSQQIGMSSSAEASYYSLLRNAAHREAGFMHAVQNMLCFSTHSLPIFPQPVSEWSVDRHRLI